ncbi:MAG: peptide chain release factor N(5)-glutamine methyltransferase [Actinobacteria bacterium]|nr:peptide chain release factor N(5)-glutamine methyltransferase [Actinomycetota bacterium]
MRELLRSAVALFEKNQISAVDAEILLAHVIGVSRKQLITSTWELPESEVTRVADEFNGLVKQRLLGKPVQYITGSAPFRYLELSVGPGVLIPRPETEILVDRVIGFLQSSTEREQAKSVVDLGAGSGTIAIAIATEAALKDLPVTVVAVEKSAEAAHWLNLNISKYELPTRVVVEDVATALDGVKADVVVANPPYIPNHERLPQEVIGFEPEMALRGGAGDGMDVPKLFISAAARLLKPGGYFITEHHETQRELVKNALQSEFKNIQSISDLTGRDRFTSGIKS